MITNAQLGEVKEYEEFGDIKLSSGDFIVRDDLDVSVNDKITYVTIAKIVRCHKML